MSPELCLQGSGTLYSPSAYYAAITLAALPTIIVNALCLSVTVYGLVGLRRSVSALLKHLVVMVLHHGIAVQVTDHTQHMSLSVLITYVPKSFNS